MRLRALLVGLLVACTLTACGGSAPEPPKLDVQAAPYIKPVYEELVKTFTAGHPGMPAAFTTGPREEDQMVQQLLRNNLVGGELPDLVFVSGNLVRVLADRGLAVPLDPFLAADAQWQKGEFTPDIAAAGRIGAKTYGLAFGYSMPVVLFNSQLVKEAGQDVAALPQTWAGVVDLARKIDKRGEGVVGGFLEYDNGGAFSFLFLLGSYGGQLLDSSERAAGFNDPRGLQALGVLRDFGAAGQAHADMTRDQARQAFGAGGIGIFITMSSMIPRLEQAAAGRFEVLSAPLPIEAPGGRLPAAGPVAVMLTRDLEKQKAVFELMKLAAGPEGQQLLAKGSGYMPANAVAVEASAELREMLAARKNSRAYLARLDEATGWYSPPGPNSTKITDTVVTHLQQVVTLKVAPEAALREMQTEVESLLPRS